MYFGAPGTSGQPISITPVQGPALEPGAPLNLLGSIKGRRVRNNDASSPAYLGSGDGSSPAEQYLAYGPANPSSTKPIQPGAPVILKNKVSCARLGWAGASEASRVSGTSGVSGTNGGVRVVECCRCNRECQRRGLRCVADVALVLQM
jgi:hypothetical protein